MYGMWLRWQHHTGSCKVCRFICVYISNCTSWYRKTPLMQVFVLVDGVRPAQVPQYQGH